MIPDFVEVEDGVYCGVIHMECWMPSSRAFARFFGRFSWIDNVIEVVMGGKLPEVIVPTSSNNI